jgi:polyisoprenoid-binding protein YceI
VAQRVGVSFRSVRPPQCARRWRGQTRPVTVHVTLKNGRYTGETTVKQTDFGIKPPGKAGVRAKDEVRIEFDVRLEG